MLKKVIGAVLILLGGFFSFVAVKAVFSNPETVNQLEELPFITDGKVDPANDGKDIILLIKPDSLDNAGDFELGLGFKYPVIRREVEELKSDGEDQLKWTRLSKSEEDFTDEVFFGKITGLEYEVEGSLLNSLGGNTKQLKFEDYDKEDLDALFEAVPALHTEEYNGVLYITDTDSGYFKDCYRKKVSDLTWDNYIGESGAIRISYRGTSVDDIDSIALVGRQVGNRLQKSDTLDTLSCYENVHSKEELIQNHKKYSVIGTGLGLVISAGLLITGVILVAKKQPI